MRNAMLALVAVLIVSGPALADPITLDAAKDNWLGDAGCGGNCNRGHGGKYYYSVPQDTIAADTMVISWDLSGVTLGPGEYIESASIQFYSAGGGNNFVFDVECYALKKAWQEGVGCPPDGYGGTGYPWGPASVGDCTKNYQIVSATDYPRGDAWVALATAGTAWQGAGATGDDDCDKTQLMTSGQWSAAGTGDKLPLGNAIPLSLEGCDILEDWITGSLGNNGMVIILTSRRVGGSVAHIATREYAGTEATAPGAYAAELTFNIVPEPASMLLLGLGGVGVLIRRKR